MKPLVVFIPHPTHAMKTVPSSPGGRGYTSCVHCGSLGDLPAIEEECRSLADRSVASNSTKPNEATHTTAHSIIHAVTTAVPPDAPGHTNLMVTPESIGDLQPTGRKFDQSKPRWDLLPLEAIAPIVDVLTFGAQKYADDNWKLVPDGKKRYFAAMMRHLAAWQKGEANDCESGLSHLAHAGCCLVFLIWTELHDNK